MKQAPIRPDVYRLSLLASGLLFATITPASAQRVLGIDVSAWQTSITATEWATFKRATNQQVSGVSGDGRDFVFIRSSRGGTTGYYDQSDPNNENGLNTLSQRYDDPYFVQNITRATAAGLFAGSYHFSRPDVTASTPTSGGIPNSGTDEANHFLQMAGAWMRPGYLLPVHDLEAGDGRRSDDEMAQFCIDFSDRIHQVMGIRPAIYINGNYSEFVIGRASSSLQAAVVAAYPTLWTARWPNQQEPNSIPVQTSHPNESVSYIYGPWDNNGVTHPWAFWQYASTARLNGHPGANIDVNVAQGGIEFVKDHLVPALWMNDEDGPWTTLTNWNSGLAPVAPVQGPGQVQRFGPLTLPEVRLPGANDTVVLDRPNANITVTLASGAHNIRKLYVREPLGISGGSLTINYVPSLDSTPIAAQFSAPVALSGIATLRVHTLQVDATRVFLLAGGAVTFDTINLMPHSSLPAKLVLSNNVTFNPLAGATATIRRGNGSGNTGLFDLGAGSRTVNIGNGTDAVDFAVDVPVINGALAKGGAGTMQLTAASSYSGGTTVSAGRLLVNNITGSGTGSGGVTVSNGILGGAGTIAGPVNVQPGGTIAPGASIGTLTINNALTLSGASVMEINAVNVTSDLIRGMSSVTYGGTLVLSNLAGTISALNAFKLFSASSYDGAFAAITPAIPGPGLAWNTNTLAIDGTLRVLSTAPTAIAGSIFGNLQTLSWPADHTGWRLQVQTNSLSVGLSANWVDVPNSVITNQITFTVDPTIGCAFYRLVFP